MSNMACNNMAFSEITIPWMHESMKRLYEAAWKTAEVTGKSAVAKLLNEAPQTLNNWDDRGLSLGGALKAQAKLGYDANWLLTGEGHGPLGHQADARPGVSDALPVVLDALAAAPARKELRDLLGLILDTDSPLYRQRLAELLDPAAAPKNRKAA